MTDPLALTFAVALAVLAVARFAWACRDGRFLASTRMASKAAFGLAVALALFAVPLIELPAEALLVPLGTVGLAGLALAPPTPRRTFVLGLIAFVAALGAALVHVVLGEPFGILIAVPAALAVGHLPLPGRPSIRFLLAIPVLAGVAALLPTPLLLAPAVLLFFAVPARPPYAVLDDREAAFDHKMVYYLGLAGVLLASMVALWAGAGGPLQDPALDDAQLAVGLLAAALLLLPILKVTFGIIRRSGVVEAGTGGGGGGGGGSGEAGPGAE